MLLIIFKKSHIKINRLKRLNNKNIILQNIFYIISFYPLSIVV
jgi:hypothetical protein